MRLFANAEEVKLFITEEVAGGTVQYIGGYGLAKALADPEARKLLKQTEINCTKFWLLQPQRALCYGEFLGPDFKEITKLQVTKHPETVNWEEELDESTTADSLASFEQDLRLLKEFGAQPIMNFKRKLHGNELKRRIYWRHVFLMNYYLNKIKNYNIVLWEFGCEDARQGPEQVEVGSDAIQESVKLTGVPVLVGGPGEDGDVDKDYNVILGSDYAERIHALSFHSFQWPEDFPLLGFSRQSSSTINFRHMPVKDALQKYMDTLQKKCRPNSVLLPYWDTGWSWKPAPSSTEEEVGPNKPLTSLAYIGRIIQQAESRCQVNVYCRLYGPRPDQDALQANNGKVIATPLFYAIRMMARANAGQKERLVVKGKPDDSIMQTLVTRSPSELFITCLSRKQDVTLKVTLSGLKQYMGKKYVIRRHNGNNLKDDITDEGVIGEEMRIDLPPLSVFQVAIQRK